MQAFEEEEGSKGTFALKYGVAVVAEQRLKKAQFSSDSVVFAAKCCWSIESYIINLFS